METLDLERIRDGFPGITPAFGEMLLEACLVCLEKQGHESGTVLHVYGDWNVDVELRRVAVSPDSFSPLVNRRKCGMIQDLKLWSVGTLPAC